MRTIKIALAATAALSMAAPAFAQYPPTQQYQQNLQNYQADRSNYDAALREYQVRRDSYEREREQYDRRYGSGAYQRAYGAAPTWDNSYDQNRYGANTSYESRSDFDRRAGDYERARRDYDQRYGYGAYQRAYGPPPVWTSNQYGQNPSYGGYDPCQGRQSTNSVAGGVIGALIGAALGSNVAARNARTEGSVLGALVGGAVGVGVGRASAKCDDRGYYYSYDQTTPYRESSYDRRRRSGQYDYSYYNRQRCRLAPAPVNGDEYRYVRVCPDGDGRYRITG